LGHPFPCPALGRPYSVLLFSNFADEKTLKDIKEKHGIFASLR
jgi:hypothetical protein